MKFNTNDEVEFELYNLESRNRPRWINNIDYGGCGNWATGIIKKIDPYNIEVHYTIEGYVGVGVCEWPNLLNPNYKTGQWNRPGYLRVKIKPKCECGAEKCKTTHSLWCPILTTGRK